MQTLLASDGDASSRVHNVGFMDIQFSDANYTTSNTGTEFSEIQATYQITGSCNGSAVQGLCTFVSGGLCPYANLIKMPGAVRVTYDRSIHFDHDHFFVHLGGAGLDLGNGTQNATATACVFTDISGNGLDLGGVDIPPPTSSAQHTSGIVVKDSTQHHRSEPDPIEHHRRRRDRAEVPADPELATVLPRRPGRAAAWSGGCGAQTSSARPG